MFSQLLRNISTLEKESEKRVRKWWNEQEVKTTNEKQVMKMFDFNKFRRKFLPTLRI